MTRYEAACQLIRETDIVRTLQASPTHSVTGQDFTGLANADFDYCLATVQEKGCKRK